MRLTVAVNDRFARVANGGVWTSGAATYGVFARYLHVFQSVRVVARVAASASPATGMQRADGAGVTFSGVPDFFRVAQYLRRRHSLFRALQSLELEADALIARLPAWHLTSDVLRRAGVRGRPFAVEVLGDPWEVLAHGVWKHPLRPWVRLAVTLRTRRLCRRASAALYVTSRSLQRRYPTAAGTQAWSCSDVELDDTAFRDLHRSHLPGELGLRLIFVGALADERKGLDVLLRALPAVPPAVSLEVVGDGRERAALERLAAKRGVGSRVTFLGALPAGAAIRERLDAADVFVLPSRSEGLPRAMLEAMARGLPCIGTSAGGMPELLSDEDVVRAGDVGALAAKIGEVMTDAARLDRMSRRNLESSRAFHASRLRERRAAFLMELRRQTEEWSRLEASR